MPLYQLYVYNTVHNNLSTSSFGIHYCHIASPDDTTHSTTVPVPVLLIWDIPQMPQYQS